jgi:hypothetical protein
VLYLIQTYERKSIWVAHVPWAAETFRLYAYAQATGLFHRNPGAEYDFWVDFDLSYEPISIARAKTVIEAGVGWRDACKDSGRLVSMLRTDTESLTLDRVIEYERTHPNEVAPRFTGGD